MDSLNYLRNVLRSWWLIVLVLLAGGVGGYIVYLQATPLYASSVTMIVANNNPSLDEATARTLAALRAQSLAQVAATQPAVAAAVAAAGGDRGGSLAVTSVASTSFVTVRVENSSASAAYAIAAQYPTTLPQSLGTLAGNTATVFSVHTVAQPVRPLTPFSPSKRRDIGLGLLAGLLIGIALAVLRETLNRSIRSGDEANQVTGLPLLGVVPRLTPKIGLPAVEDPRGARAEAYRQVRTTLLSQTDKRPLILAVTSATIGEGKTSVAANLAVVLARAGHSVVLIDADMRRPQVAQLFDLPGDTGLSDVLRRTVDIQQALVEHAESGLRILPAGPTPPNPSELLGGVDLSDLVSKLAETAEFVVIDTPPVLPVSDARELVPAVDGFVCVVQLGGPNRDRVRRAIVALERVNAVLFGIVPNQAGREVLRDYRYAYRYEPPTRPDSPQPHPASDLRGNPGRHSASQ